MTKDKDGDDPWDGWPDTPWVLDGYILDEALCDLIAQCHGHYDGVYYEDPKEALDVFLERIRNRDFDKKEEND